MNPLKRSAWHGGVFALALIAVALVVSLLIRPYLEPETFLLFLVAVWLSAWYHGRTVGLLAVGVSAAALVYFLVSGSTPLRAAPGRLASFVVIALLITWVTAAWRESRTLLVSTLSSMGEAVLATD